MTYDISSITIKDEVLGTGAFGRVNVAEDNKKQPLAAKICRSNEYGIPNIFEPTLMSSLDHPHINRALDIFPKDQKLYIFQEKAVSDLAHQVKYDYGGSPYQGEKLKLVLYRLANAVACLHEENILHCDIKGTNVLYFSDDDIRLTDFTLSIRKYSPDENYDHTVATSTHRPLECFLGQKWDEKLDIWSLACTFYEIIFGHNLMIYQGQGNPYQDIVDDRERKKRRESLIKRRNIYAHLELGRRLDPEYIDQLIQEFDLEPQPQDLIMERARNLVPSFLSTPLGHLMERMLQPNPQKRPTMKEILQHPYFEGMEPIPYKVYYPQEYPLELEEKERLEDYNRRFGFVSLVGRVSQNIYSKIKNYQDLEGEDPYLGALWISYKIIYNHHASEILEDYELKKMIELERNICTYLMFRFL